MKTCIKSKNLPCIIFTLSTQQSKRLRYTLFQDNHRASSGMEKVLVQVLEDVEIVSLTRVGALPLLESTGDRNRRHWPPLPVGGLVELSTIHGSCHCSNRLCFCSGLGLWRSLSRANSRSPHYSARMSQGQPKLADRTLRSFSVPNVTTFTVTQFRPADHVSSFPPPPPHLRKGVQPGAR